MFCWVVLWPLMQWTFWRRIVFCGTLREWDKCFGCFRLRQPSSVGKGRECAHQLLKMLLRLSLCQAWWAAQPCNPSSWEWRQDSQELSTLETEIIWGHCELYETVSQKTKQTLTLQTKLKQDCSWVYRLAGYIHSRNNHLASIYLFMFVCLFIYIYNCLCVCTPDPPVSNSQVLELQVCTAVLFMWCC